MTQWAPTDKNDERRLYDLFIGTRVLAGKTNSQAIDIIQKKLKVKTSQAYNILNFLKAKGWIFAEPRLLVIPERRGVAS